MEPYNRILKLLPQGEQFRLLDEQRQREHERRMAVIAEFRECLAEVAAGDADGYDGWLDPQDKPQWRGKP
jgi:hypothetical protein